MGRDDVSVVLHSLAFGALARHTSPFDNVFIIPNNVFRWMCHVVSQTDQAGFQPGPLNQLRLV